MNILTQPDTEIINIATRAWEQLLDKVETYKNKLSKPAAFKPVKGSKFTRTHPYWYARKYAEKAVYAAVGIMILFLIFKNI